MIVAELMEMLEGMDPEMEVRIATQPEWPLAFHVKNAVIDTSTYRHIDKRVLWILTGEHPDDLPYAPGFVFDEIGD